MRTRLWTITMVALTVTAGASERPKGPALFAITNAKVVTGTGTNFDPGSIVIDGGLIASVGRSVEIPEGAWVIDGAGKVVYPGLVDALGDFGLSRDAESKDEPFARGPEDRPGTTSWAAAADELTLEDDRIEKWRSSGFTSAVTSPSDGIVSGQAAYINLAGERARDLVVATPAALRVNLEFEPPPRSFPSSLMGVMAYVKQIFADASHYRDSWASYEAEPRGKRRPGYDRALAPLAEAQRDGWPVLLPAHWEHEIVRAVRLGKETGVRPVVYGLYEGHAAAELLAAEGVPALVSVDWPERDEGGDPELEEPLRVLRMRDRAPGTPAALASAGVTFAFYSDGLKDPEEILSGVKKAIAAGLSRERAIVALTSAPASIFGVDDRVGSLEAGKIANVIVTNGDLFDDGTRVETVFVDGNQYQIRARTDDASDEENEGGTR